MANSQTDELREFDRLDLLLSQIPKKAQHGILKSCDLVLTCIDANISFIVLGTNVGTVFLFSRKDSSMQRLKSGSTNDVITAVKLHHGIDDQLAFATASGDLFVYCMPGVVSMQKKQLQKFDVKDVHKHYVTCLEWITNGMKLYSGDKIGQVVVTEVDFYEGQCRSSLLLIETGTEIVQLDYKHKILLVSTRRSSFIVRIDQKCQIVPVGTKDRKIQGPFGACFIPGMCKPDDARLYAARPGCRLWLSDVEGVVQSTHIFSDPLATTVSEIPLISAGKLQISKSEFQFGILKWFREREIVTWSASALVVLDPEANRVVARQGRLSGVVDVAIVDETGEIFLLRRHAEARVIRIATAPEPKFVRAEIVPVVPVQVMNSDLATAAKEEKDKENAAEILLKKLAGPLKRLDKSHSPDRHATAPFEQTRTKELTSPDLPPVVRLASPELEGLRVFTGGSQPIEISLIPPAAGTGAGLEVSPGLPAQPSSQACPASATSDPELLGSSPAVSSADHQLQCESLAHTADLEKNDIVFSHKTRKHKKKKYKEGLLAPRDKDDDNISLVSASSQISDDASVAGSSPATYSRSISSPQPHSDGPSLVVDGVINTDHLSQPHSDGLSLDGVITTDRLLADHCVNSETLALISELKSYPQTDIENKNVNQSMESTNNAVEVSETETVDGSHFAQSNDNSIDNYDPHNSDISTRGQSRRPDIFLSENDQQHEQIQKLKESNSVLENKEKFIQDPSEILENAMANLAKSRTTSTEASPQIVPNSQPKSQSFPSQTRQAVISQTSFQDIYSEIELIESTDPFHKGYKRESSADDFYSLFQDTSPESPVTPEAKPRSVVPLRPSTTLPSEAERSSEMQDVVEHRLVNTWSEFTTPANIYSLVVSNNHIWFTDKNENIYYSTVGTPKGILWRKATGRGSQISVSPSGHIVWCLHRGTVYAGTKISSRHPEGLKWVEAIRDVQMISVDNECAWFVMNNGDVMMQRRLSLERPCYKSQKVECSYKLKHILVRHGVVWAVTEELGLLVRTGITNEMPEGTGWHLDEREQPPYLFSHIALDNENIGWVIDVLGHIWFCDGVTREQPLGRRRWWQVPLSEYILHDETTMDMIRGLARKFDPKKLSYIMSTSKGGLITAGSQGVWLALEFRNILNVCRGNVQGYHWLEAQPAQMSPSSAWRQVRASISHLDWGLVWAQHTNGDVFTFKQARSEATMISDCSDYCCISVGPTATWALTFNGDINVRTGMGPSCPQGNGWVDLDISQLGDAHIVHLSCNSLYVWAVEAEGVVYQRIGAKPPSENNLSPAWLPIDTSAAIVFTQVHTGPLDWMVWAIDNRRLTYVRAGITECMPIGQEWVHVPGLHAMDLALTKSGVWALSPNGEIYFRHGIARDRPCGNYWKKIPGTFAKISASACDDLWGINTEGQLMQCSVQCLMRHQDSNDPLLQRNVSTCSTASDDVDWEFV